jgi:hypothetical protein
MHARHLRHVLNLGRADDQRGNHRPIVGHDQVARHTDMTERLWCPWHIGSLPKTVTRSSFVLVVLNVAGLFGHAAEVSGDRTALMAGLAHEPGSERL